MKFGQLAVGHIFFRSEWAPKGSHRSKAKKITLIRKKVWTTGYNPARFTTSNAIWLEGPKEGKTFFLSDGIEVELR